MYVTNVIPQTNDGCTCQSHTQNEEAPLLMPSMDAVTPKTGRKPSVTANAMSRAEEGVESPLPTHVNGGGW